MTIARARSPSLRDAVRAELLALAAMAGLLAAGGWLVAAIPGVVMVLAAVAALAVLVPRLPSRLVMRLHGAVPVALTQAEPLYGVVIDLAEAFGLARLPVLYRLPNLRLNAFAAGNRRDPAIAISDGMIRTLSPRELRGVLAHEMAHLFAGDTELMRLCEILGRVMHATAVCGLFASLLVMILLPASVVPFSVVLVLAFLPTLITLIQLAISRRREFAADMMAARFTRDPLGLASALGKIERLSQGRRWLGFEDFSRAAIPTWLRTHPPTAERIGRLTALARDPLYQDQLRPGRPARQAFSRVPQLVLSRLPETL